MNVAGVQTFALPIYLTNGDRWRKLRTWSRRQDCRRHTYKQRRVREGVVGDETAALEIEHDRDQHRDDEDERRRGAGDDVVDVVRPEQQQRGVEGVDGEVPDQQRQETDR